MRSRIVTALAAVLLTVTAGVLAQSSGFPSRPKFQAVGVGAAAGANGTLTVAGTASEKIRVFASDALGDAYVSGYSNDGTTPRWYLGNGGTGDNIVTLHNYVSAAALNLSTTGGGAINANGSPVVTSASIGALLPKLSRGSVGVSGSCTSSGVGMANGACTYVGVGIVTVSLAAAGYTSTPTCSVTLSGLGATTTSSIFIDSVSGSAPNYNLNVSIRKNSAGLADGNFFVLCLGA